MRRLALAAGLLLGGCVPENGPLMRPGEDCLRCHGGEVVPDGADAGFAPRHARTWSLAGTVYAAPDADPDAGVLGAEVQIVDANGWSFSLRTNLAGNFYSAEDVAFPLSVCVARDGRTSCMLAPATFGSCNACHAWPPANGAPGRLTAP